MQFTENQITYEITKINDIHSIKATSNEKYWEWYSIVNNNIKYINEFDNFDAETFCDMIINPEKKFGFSVAFSDVVYQNEPIHITLTGISQFGVISKNILTLKPIDLSEFDLVQKKIADLAQKLADVQDYCKDITKHMIKNNGQIAKELVSVDKRFENVNSLVNAQYETVRLDVDTQIMQADKKVDDTIQQVKNTLGDIDIDIVDLYEAVDAHNDELEIHDIYLDDLYTHKVDSDNKFTEIETNIVDIEDDIDYLYENKDNTQKEITHLGSRIKLLASLVSNENVKQDIIFKEYCEKNDAIVQSILDDPIYDYINNKFDELKKNFDCRLKSLFRIDFDRYKKLETQFKNYCKVNEQVIKCIDDRLKAIEQDPIYDYISDNYVEKDYFTEHNNILASNVKKLEENFNAKLQSNIKHIRSILIE